MYRYIVLGWDDGNAPENCVTFADQRIAIISLLHKRASLLTFIFLLFGGGPEALPWKSSCDEIHEDVAQRLHVVPPALFNA